MSDPAGRAVGPAAPAAGPGDSLRRLPWLPILVALDTVLVAAVLVLAVLATRPASPGPAPSAGGVSSSPGGVAPTAPASPSVAPTPGPPRFRLPSGNIACDMTAEGVTCTIASITFAPPPVEGCSGTVGHTVTLGADGVAVPCVEGDPPGVAGADVPVLFYGSSSEVGEYTCTSATNGVTCVDAGGTGFRLARGSLTMLR